MNYPFFKGWRGFVFVGYYALNITCLLFWGFAEILAKDTNAAFAIGLIIYWVICNFILDVRLKISYFNIGILVDMLNVTKTFILEHFKDEKKEEK
jgi:hypothetical protein